MPAQDDPDRPTNPPEPPSTPSNTKASSKGTNPLVAESTTKQQFQKLQQRVESRRSARSRNHQQDPILAPGFGTQRDLQRLARELSQASSSVFTADQIQCLMERRGRGLRAQAEEEAKAPATSSAWDDFMKEAGMGAAAKKEEEEDLVVTGKRGRASVAAEATAATVTSTASSSRVYNLTPLETAASANKKLKPNSNNVNGGILLQTGTLDCAVVGRKMAELNWNAPHTLSVPTRILSSAIKIQKVIAAGHACHCIAITTTGVAYGWGRNEQQQLGSSFPKNVYQPAPLSKDQVNDLVIDAAVGKGHSLLLLRSGEMMSCGSNKSGQCGINSTAIEVVPNFRVSTFAAGGEMPTIVQVACGEDFSVALCSEGKIYNTGSSEFGQLGNGSTGEYFVTANKLAFANCATFTRRSTFCHAPNEKIYSTSDTNTKVVPLSEDIRIQQIACGKHHTMALEADVEATDANVQPRLFTWGCGNYGVLGHGVQADEYFPRNVGALGNLYFTASGGARRAAIAAGQHCSLLLTGQGHVYYWGKHRTMGEATMRPALVDALAHNDHIVTHCAAGGQTVVCCTAHGQSVGWGQGPHGELGLGLDRKSSSKPTFIPGLEGCHVLSLGCGYGTTVFVVRDSEDADRAAIAKIPVLNPSATDGLAAANGDDLVAPIKPAVGKKGKAK